MNWRDETCIVPPIDLILPSSVFLCAHPGHSNVEIGSSSSNNCIGRVGKRQNLQTPDPDRLFETALYLGSGSNDHATAPSASSDVTSFEVLDLPSDIRQRIFTFVDATVIYSAKEGYRLGRICKQLHADLMQEDSSGRTLSDVRSEWVYRHHGLRSLAHAAGYRLGANVIAKLVHDTNRGLMVSGTREASCMTAVRASW